MLMKRRLPVLPVCMLLFLLTGCSSETENGWEEDGKAIRFSLPSLTRTIINGLTDLKKDGNAYAVWGQFTSNTESGQATRLFNQEPIIYNAETDKWDYTTEERFWYIGNTYHFHALYPHPQALISGIVAYDYNQAPSGQLSINNFNALSGNTSEEKVDLLYANHTDIDITTENDIPQYGVSLAFKHLLSRVSFVGRSDEKYLGTERRIIIDSARLYGIKTIGNWNSETINDNTPSGSWTLIGDPLTNGSDEYNFSSEEPLPTEGISIFGDNILFIPQSLTDAIFEIKYHYNIGAPEQRTITFNLSDYTATWEPGKSYRYPFTISNHIFFQTPTVEEWKYAPVNGSDFNVDVD